jgi:hypothetical protein
VSHPLPFLRRRRRSQGVELISSPFSSLAADGWQGSWAGVPGSTLPMQAFNVTRPGHDDTGAEVNHIDTIYATRRIRKPYPDHADFSDSPYLVALSEKLLSTDILAGGATNNASAAAPKPVANWLLYDRTVVGDSVTVELGSGHYNGRNNSQIALAEFRATDGVNTVFFTAASTVVGGRSSDKNAVLVYRGTLNLSTLNNGPITVNAKCFPWIGTAASVLDSADQSARREFSPRFFLKDTTRAANPPYAYVKTAANGGSDAGGVWSTNAATAAASPFETVRAAIIAAASQMPAGAYAALIGTGTSRPLDGAILRVGEGTFALGTDYTSTRPQKLGAVTITRDPNVARIDCIVSFGTTANFRPRLGVATLESVTTEGAIIFQDISILRTSTFIIAGESTGPSHLDVIFDDVSYNNASISGVILSNAHGRVYGMTVTNNAASVLTPGTYEWRCFRGLSVDLLNTSGLEAWIVVGCNIDRPNEMSRAAGRTASKSIIAFNKFTRITFISPVLQQGKTEDINGLVVMQNLFEGIGTSVGAIQRISGDSDTGNLTHVIHLNNTYTGFDDLGRINFAYNDTAGGARTHTFIRSAANILVSINSKHDIFMTDGTRVQSLEYNNGVGSVGEFAMFNNADNGAVRFGQDYAGVLASIGTSNTVRNDPLFTDYQGTIDGSTPGVGGGTYTLQPSSPCRQRVWTGFLSHDLAGNPRPAPILGNVATYDAAGAYTA